MSQATTEKKLSQLLTPDTKKDAGGDVLQQMADTLMQQAATARSNGDPEAAAKLLRAAANILGGDEFDDMPMSRGTTRSGRPDGRKQTTPETEKIKSMLRE